MQVLTSRSSNSTTSLRSAVPKRVPPAIARFTIRCNYSAGELSENDNTSDVTRAVVSEKRDGPASHWSSCAVSEQEPGEAGSTAWLQALSGGELQVEPDAEYIEEDIRSWDNGKNAPQWTSTDESLSEENLQQQTELWPESAERTNLWVTQNVQNAQELSSSQMQLNVEWSENAHVGSSIPETAHDLPEASENIEHTSWQSPVADVWHASDQLVGTEVLQQKHIGLNSPQAKSNVRTSIGMDFAITGTALVIAALGLALAVGVSPDVNVTIIQQNANAAIGNLQTALSSVFAFIPTMRDRVISTAPTIFSFMLQSSGLVAVHKIQQDKSTGDLSPFTFVSMLTNCAVWTVYGLLIKDLACVVPNVTGLLFGAYYTYVFATNTAQDMRGYLAGSGLVVSSICVAALILGPVAAPVIGFIGAAACVVLLSSPLATIGTVIRTQSTASMTFAICFASFWNALSWVLYGTLLAQNPLIVVPNSLGLIATMLQLSMFVRYPSKRNAVQQRKAV